MALDYLVVAELYMTPTAELADLILPVATWAEVDALPAVPFMAKMSFSPNRRPFSIMSAFRTKRLWLKSVAVSIRA